jgi:hypothetical protein
MKNYQAPSEKTQLESSHIAKATQKPGQTKEQTKLIAQGIEKGIALYKKQQKEKNRQADRAKKRQSTAPKNQVTPPSNMTTPIEEASNETSLMITQVTPWVALIISWLLFAAHWFSSHNQ